MGAFISIFPNQLKAQPGGNFSIGKFGSLSPRKASCNRVALPNLK